MLIACSGSSDTNIDGTQVIEPKAAEIKGLAKAAFGGVAFASIQARAAQKGLSLTAVGPVPTTRSLRRQPKTNAQSIFLYSHGPK